MKFPKGFFWGASTASHQVEGNTYNNWSVWEELSASKLVKRAPQFYSWMKNKKEILNSAIQEKNYISGNAVEHYSRYKADLELAKKIGLNAYRFSIEWSRIEPQKGKFVESEILHYVEMIKYMKSIGIAPFVTLWHWTHPVWLEQEGGVISKDFTKHFSNYVSYVLKYLGNEVEYWITVNEPEVYSGNSFLMGEWPPAQKSKLNFIKSYLTLATSHNKAYEVIKKISPNSKVSFAKHNTAFVRGNRNILTTISVFFSKFTSSDIWFWLTRNHFDYIGLNNYTRSRIEGLKLNNEDIKVNDLGWELYPDSVYQCLMDLKKYNKPIVITENGLADSKDEHRSWYIKEVVKSMNKALERGVDLKGYMHWSLLDNFEWSHGFWPEFGLIHVDRQTQKRTIRKSAFAYGEIIRKSI